MTSEGLVGRGLLCHQDMLASHGLVGDLSAAFHTLLVHTLLQLLSVCLVGVVLLHLQILAVSDDALVEEVLAWYFGALAGSEISLVVTSRVDALGCACAIFGAREVPNGLRLPLLVDGY